MNKQGPIQARCGYARKNNLFGCKQRYYKTERWAIFEETYIRPTFIPTIKCCIHPKPNVSYIYGWTNEYDKFVPGIGDEIVNFQEIWTLIAWQKANHSSNKSNFRNWNKARYHFSDIALESFTDNFIVQS